MFSCLIVFKIRFLMKIIYSTIINCYTKCFFILSFECVIHVYKKEEKKYNTLLFACWPNCIKCNLYFNFYSLDSYYELSQKKTGFNLYQSWHCTFITYSVKTWFLKTVYCPNVPFVSWKWFPQSPEHSGIDRKCFQDSVHWRMRFHETSCTIL